LASRFGFEAPSWDEIYGMLLDLTDQIRVNGFEPDIIVGISRGGLIPARVLSDLLENPHLTSVGAEYYVGVCETKSEPLLTQQSSVNVFDKRVLLVDDVVDTGRSIVLIRDHLYKQGLREIRILTLYCKPWSTVQPDFCSRKTSDWIVFPWEIRETLTKLAKKGKESNGSVETAANRLVRSGIDKALVARLLKEQ
jgi:hypothetical protein